MEIVMTLHGSKNVLNKKDSKSTSLLEQGWVGELIGNGVNNMSKKKGTNVIQDDTVTTIRPGAIIFSISLSNNLKSFMHIQISRTSSACWLCFCVHRIISSHSFPMKSTPSVTRIIFPKFFQTNGARLAFCFQRLLRRDLLRAPFQGTLGCRLGRLD